MHKPFHIFKQGDVLDSTGVDRAWIASRVGELVNLSKPRITGKEQSNYALAA